MNADQIMKVLYWIATFVKPQQIVKNIEDEFGFTINKSLIHYYGRQEDYKKTINKIRERWSNDLFDCELANKRRRIEELQKIYEHCYNTDQMKNALASIYQIQHEIEKDIQNLQLNNYTVNMYKDMTEMELEEERVKSLERLKILKGEIVDASEKRETTEINGDCGTQPSSGTQRE
jgi:hypothetical protein